MTWRERAACRSVDPEMFYPLSAEREARAKRVCAICPVRTACLDHALRTREPDGVWGGLTEPERLRILRGWVRGHEGALA